MRVKSVTVGPFRSIENEQVVNLDNRVTVLVGMNEAGKTVFLQSVRKTQDALGVEKFDPVHDYPRKNLTAYQKRHTVKPEKVVTIVYSLDDKEASDLSAHLHATIPGGFTFSVTTFFDNKKTIGVEIDEAPAVSALAETTGLSTDARDAIKKAKTVRAAASALAALERKTADEALLASINARVEKAGTWTSVVANEAWTWLSSRVPKFAFFGDYELLPGKMNLSQLAKQVAAAQPLTPAERGILALLRMADVTLEEISKAGAYEPTKAKLESVSIQLTDQIFEFWKQNENLEVEVDIKADATDAPPFNDGPNLYLRIRNRRHRGVSTSFDQRSRGFVWFFSFLVWFDEVQHQLDPAGKALTHQLVLLLDEPGLSLHALAQADLLRYVDKLAESHQVVYTTHSPFMVHSDRMDQIRIVEDRVGVGTVITDELKGSDGRTVFPLQAALGWTIAQNLFIGRRNLLVEGASELVYLNFASSAIEKNGKRGLRDDITITPVGGLDKVATFIALLGANELELVVLHDYRGAPEQRLLDLVREKIISEKVILNPSQFRGGSAGKKALPSDIEDLFDEDIYVEAFNKAYAKQLGGASLVADKLPAGDRIVERIERDLTKRGLQVRPSGGFNHYTVAAYMAANPPTLGKATLERLSDLIEKINGLFTTS